MELFKNKNIILASKSPRRHQLLNDLGLQFSIQTIEVEEVYPPGLSMTQIAEYLAKHKSEPFERLLSENDILITADTIVWINGEVLGKPRNREEAILMLQKLSGSLHQVITGVCLKSPDKTTLFSSITNVYFKELLLNEIEYYIDEYQPFDKAGAYGIQEWIGYIGIKHIEGSFYNVMGLPIQKLYEELILF